MLVHLNAVMVNVDYSNDNRYICMYYMSVYMYFQQKRLLLTQKLNTFLQFCYFAVKPLRILKRLTRQSSYKKLQQQQQTNYKVMIKYAHTYTLISWKVVWNATAARYVSIW